MNIYAPTSPGPTAGPPEREALLASVRSDAARRRVEALRPDGPYDWATLFPKTSGMGAASDIKRRARILSAIEPRLDHLLYPGERLEFVTTGALNSWLEQYFMGAWSLLVNRTAFLFTNMRVVLINADLKDRPKTLMWQIPYERMRSYGSGVLVGSVAFKTTSGRSFRFASVPSADRKRLRDAMAARLAAVRSEGIPFPSHADRDPLCFQCGTPTPPRVRACQECGDPFIRPEIPALLSFIVPGLGHLYLGHRTIAAMEVGGYALAVGFLVVQLVTVGVTPILPVMAVVLPMAHISDAAITWHIARKGNLPRRLAWVAP